MIKTKALPVKGTAWERHGIWDMQGVGKVSSLI